jgi:hypothetical protein
VYANISRTEKLEVIGGIMYTPVLPGPDKHSRPHPPKSAPIFEAFKAIYQKSCPCIIFQNTTTILKKT